MKKYKSIGMIILSICLLGGCVKVNDQVSENSTEKSTERNVEESVKPQDEEKKEEIGEETITHSPVTEDSNINLNGKTIVLDPGHSSVMPEGSEPVGPGSSEYKAADAIGTKGVSTGMPEYELTLIVSQKLRLELENRGYTVLLTRESNDVPVSCVQRADVANKAQATAFVRIHANGSENSEAQGAMTICTTPQSPYAAGLYSQSRALSDSIINHLCIAAGCENDGVWETDTMSGNNWSQVPVTIVEMGYMTNPQEDQNLVSEDYQNKIVTGIADGIDEYCGIAGSN